MLFFQLFYTFSKIGIFNFGGGYAMLSLIYNDVVVKNQWITSAEFTNIVAISQTTPGPIGINAATYVGYAAAINQGYPEWAAACASVLASLSVMWLPFILMITISAYLIKHKNDPIIESVFKYLRPTIVGLIAAAAIMLMNKENFGDPTADLPGFIMSLILFAGAFATTKYLKFNPILVMLVCGLIGVAFETIMNVWI